MNQPQAISTLTRAGFQARAADRPDFVIVLAPFVTYTGGQSPKFSHEPKQLHIDRVWQFIHSHQ